MPKVGYPAPQFSGNDVLTGKPFSLAQQQGKVVVVAFVCLKDDSCGRYMVPYL
jgi:peroxiredoxin